jgi:Lon protease-like protein
LVDLPVFAVHDVLFPGQSLSLRVFEERYLRMMETVLPDRSIVIAAIRAGREVGGPSEPFRVGVTATARDHTVGSDGVIEMEVVGRERVALVERLATRPFPIWRTEVFPDEGGAGTRDVEVAARAFHRFLRATGMADVVPAIPHDPVVASYVLAAAVPALPPQRQALLAAPGAGERLRLVRDAFALEARLISTLHAGVGGADPAVNPN